MVGARLEGKLALITGGATGIGAAIAACFVEEGASVVLAARDADRGRRVARSMGDAATWRTLDVTDADAWQAVLSDVGASLDVLVNNAGGLLYPRPLHEIEPAEWRHELDINLTGAFLGMRYAIPYMLPRGRGSIINVGSISGVRGQEDAPGYGAAKGGLRLLAKHAAHAYGARGIRVNTINPGAIRTAAVEAEPLERTQPFVERTPMRRWGLPREVGLVAVFLASDESGFVTGSDYDVDGGYLA